MATAKFYSKYFHSLMTKEINMATDVLKIMLCGAGYTPDQDAHRYKSDVTSEIVGAGYTAGGATVGSIVIAYDAPTNVLSFDGTDANWPAATITNARWGVLYDSTPATDAARPLIGYVDFGGLISSVAANFGVVWAGNGIGAVTVS